MARPQKTILLTGGSGRLGSVIRTLIPCIAPTSKELDIVDFQSCRRAMARYRPDVIIHCAGYVNAARAEKEKGRCWITNVVGTRNMVQAAKGKRFIYISSDYVFDGEKGNYQEDDTPYPVNFYGLTKLAGELIVAQYPHTLIARAPFRPDGPWGYPKAFSDQWTSCVFASQRAPQIIEAALRKNLEGVIHIGGPRRSIYAMAKSVSPDVGKLTRAEFPSLRIPRDTSFNDTRWRKEISKRRRVKK